MGRKLSSVYEVLIHGVGRGLAGHELYDHIQSGCKVSSNKRICRASMIAMSDARVSNRDVLEGIYTIAIDRHIRCGG